MEQKLVKVPFEVELAKEITNGTKEGKVVTRNGRNVRIICWDARCDDNIVVLIEGENGVEFTKNYVSDGMVFLTGESEYDLMLEIPECMTFKDGDIVIYNKLGDFAILQEKPYLSNGMYCCHYKVASVGGYKEIAFYKGNQYIDMTYARVATDEDRKGIIKNLIICKDGGAKECLKMLGVEEKKEYEFKPFDKVLVKDDDENSAWSCNLFSGKNEDGTYMCIGGYWDMCIPYNDQTKHLLGTTDNWEE